MLQVRKRIRNPEKKGVVLILSKDDKKLSDKEVKTWVDNFRKFLNRKKT